MVHLPDWAGLPPKPTMDTSSGWCIRQRSSGGFCWFGGYCSCPCKALPNRFGCRTDAGTGSTETALIGLSIPALEGLLSTRADWCAPFWTTCSFALPAIPNALGWRWCAPQHLASKWGPNPAWRLTPWTRFFEGTDEQAGCSTGWQALRWPPHGLPGGATQLAAYSSQRWPVPLRLPFLTLCLHGLRSQQ